MGEFDINNYYGDDYIQTDDTDTSTDGGVAPSVNYATSYERPSYYNDDEGKTLKTRDQYIKEWNEANKAPERPADVAAVQEKAPSYDDLLNAYKDKKDEKYEKNKRASLIISGIGDMINAISSMYAANRSGAYTAPKQTLSEAAKARYDAMEKAQATERQNYRTMLMNRAKLRQQAYLQRQKANDAKAAAINKANKTAYDNAMKNRNTQLNTDLTGLRQAQQDTETKAYRAQQQDNFNKSMRQRWTLGTMPTTSTHTNTNYVQTTDPEGNPMVDVNGKPVVRVSSSKTTATTRKGYPKTKKKK